MDNQPNNPLHGVKLADILEHLVNTFGWDELSAKISINCFRNNPSIKSSLKFLRRTPWARDKVERLYLRSIGKRPPRKKTPEAKQESAHPREKEATAESPWDAAKRRRESRG